MSLPKNKHDVGAKEDVGEKDGRSKNVLVWGGLGFIGYHLTEYLLSRGYKVSILCRSRSSYPVPSWNSRVRWFELHGESNTEILEKAVASSSVIFNLAGSSGAAASNLDPIASLTNNCSVQLEFLQACRVAGHRPHVIFSSSRLVYGETNGRVVGESYPTLPRSAYAIHKLCAEQYMQLYSSMGFITHTICRISNAYGPDRGHAGRGYKILNSFILKSLQGQPITIYGLGDQMRDFIYVSDLVDALAACAFNPSAQNVTLNIGSGEQRSMLEAANLIRSLTDGPPVIFQTWPAEYLAVESGDYICDITRAQQLLDFQPRFLLADGIGDTVRAYRELPDRGASPRNIEQLDRTIAVAS
jgi:UDP-glucose 4-epimerase